MQLCRLCTALHQWTETHRDEILHFETRISDLASSAGYCQGICRFVRATVLYFVEIKAQKQTVLLVAGAGRGSPSHFRIHGADGHYNKTFAIELYTDLESSTWPWCLFYKGLPIPRWPGCPTGVLDRCLGWLNTCKAGHKVCAHQDSLSGCTVRILDCRNSLLRLVEDFDVSNHRFAALSHCWGDATHIVTRKASLHSHRQNIPRSQLPLTFHQAVQVCEHLGLDFLWIDSLCIVQDDVSDWANESCKMGAVYQAAEVVISADGARSSSEGLFLKGNQSIRLSTPSSRRSATPVALYGRPAIEHAHHTSAQVEESLREPLSQRAWVLQEWLLARRVLHFGKQEIVWDCRHTLDCECQGFALLLAGHPVPARQQILQERRVLRGPMVNLVTDAQSGHRHWSNLIKLWIEVVTEYTARRLTKYRDRLAAIDGLAGAFINSSQQSGVGRYGSGLFGRDAADPLVLASQVLWSRCGDGKPHARPAHHVAPTWSWAAIDEAVEWLGPMFSALDDAQNAQITVVASLDIESCLKLTQGDTVGAYTGGTIRLKAHVLEGEIQPTAVYDWGQCLVQLRRPDDDVTKARGNVLEEIIFSLDVDLGQLLKGGPLEVFCARVLDFTEDVQELAACLVLTDSAGTQDSVPICERLGVATDQIPRSWFDGAPLKDIFIR